MIYASYIIFVATALFCHSADSAESTGCSTNEGKYQCGRRCEERCNAPAPALCGGLRCEGFACRCKNGYARDPYTNQCVAKADCPVSECAVGEIKGPCGRRCEGTCNYPTAPGICQRIKCSESSCRCDLAGEFVRNSQGKCVRMGDC